MHARRAAPLGCVLALALVLAPPALAAESAIETEALRATVTHDPFSLAFSDRASGQMLRSAGGGGPPGLDNPNARQGPLGYAFNRRLAILNSNVLGYEQNAEAETLWFHATKVRGERRDGDALVLELETNDPGRHRLELRLEPAGQGAIALRSRLVPGSGPLASLVSASGASFAAPAGERYLGFGERSNAVDQTGIVVRNWAEEGPFSSQQLESIRPSIPDFTFPTGPTTTNLPIPWLLSTRGLGVLIDQGHRSFFRLRTDRRDAWHAQADAPELALTIVPGPTPAKALERYSALAGRQPAPPDWIFGPWVQFRDPWPERFREQNVPTTVAQTYTHYLPCGVHRGRERQERERVERHHRLGYKITTYLNSHLCTSYQPNFDEAAAKGYLVRSALGGPQLISNFGTAEQLAGEFDFTNPEAKAYWQRLLDEPLAAGYDGWMEDFGEYTPADARFHDGRRGEEMHNLYTVLYHQASTEHTKTRAPAVFVRSGYHGVQRHARVVWGGDPSEDWSCSDGLCASIHQSLSAGLSGIAYWGTDIGGFHAITTRRTNHELNVRWLQAGFANGIMRTQANGFSFRDDRATRSQVWSDEVLPVWTRYARLRTQLAPYLAAASAGYQRTGVPLARHHVLTWPDDPRAVARQTEFMLGPDLLAAPVVEPGARQRRLYLPRGEWIGLWRAVRYDPARGGFALAAARAELLGGGRDLTVDAPLEELPLLARAGTLLPLLSPTVETLASDLPKHPDVVRASDRASELRILAFPRGSSSAGFGAAGETMRSAERSSRRWVLRVDGRRTRTLRVQASLATLRRPFAPCRVTANGRALPPRAWRYDRASRVLRVTIRRRALRLEARGSCSPRAR